MKEIPIKTGMLLLTMCTYMGLKADPPPPPTGPMMMGPIGIIFPFPDPEGKEFEKLSTELKLTKEQKDKIKTSLDKREILLKENMERMPSLHEDLRNILESEKVELSSVRSKLQEISNIQLELRMIQIQGRLEFESQLTKEQRTNLKALHKKRMDQIKPKKGFPSDRFECPPPKL
ncbi:Spy/CpxP family protein refolding chaperone [Leptospira idonii]|uniref:Periplasmic heavy metal sensor n=1 Tax=Leptospira idonii TaxID=1193500 RepID=A0A4R9M592_9LEPT|nr:Spy/CpxP family protein refolding chaperone [Leptospira idonii]TGN20867.1 periplasmic heavy metal sensor [Leptospira idonii]